MCGISGRFNFRTGRPVDPHVIEGMCSALAHRGPDGGGAYVQGELGLANRRLAVIGLGDAGHQPMRYRETGVRITYNGEIYNYRELRAELEDLGFMFSTKTDTEVILASYVAHAANCVLRLRGMFAFAIWDEAKHRLLLARDRVGEKPLYYFEDADGIAFASEPKAFLADPTWSPRPNLGAIADYLTFQYVPGPRTAFAGVSKLAPASYLTVTSGGIESTRYWSLSFSRRALPASAALETTSELVRDAVRSTLVSDVPVGAFLSGGLDSSVVVALAASLSQEPIRTFSIGFRDDRYNELPQARIVARHFGTKHQEFVVEPDIASVVTDLAWHYGEPLADASAIPTFLLAKMASREVKVVMTGDGGDENFGGYDRYVALLLAERLGALPRLLVRGIGRLHELLPAPQASRTPYSRLYGFLGTIPMNRVGRYGRWMTHISSDLKRSLCTQEFLRTANQESLDLLANIFGRYEGTGVLNQAMAADLAMYLPDDLLLKTDVATMAHGLEARAPLLDHRLLEFTSTLEERNKVRWGRGKWILRQAARRLVPEKWLTYPKRGFGVPLDKWLRGPLGELAADVLMSRRFQERGIFRADEVSRLLDEHRAGKTLWHQQIWNMLMLELWFRAYVDRHNEAGRLE